MPLNTSVSVPAEKLVVSGLVTSKRCEAFVG